MASARAFFGAASEASSAIFGAACKLLETGGLVVGKGMGRDG